MNRYNENNQKLTYYTPQIVIIKLDNEISLALESTPPIGPGWELSSSFVISDFQPIEIF